MSRIITYLTFNGNCKKAMTFYRDCLGGELHLQTIGESPNSDHLPSSMKGFILQAFLENQQLSLMGTDMANEIGLSKGNTVSLYIACKNRQEMQRYFSKLSENGKITQPISTNHWGNLFGTLTDQFGHHWILQCPDTSQ
ncbi:VOC family protein [Echinicola sediminis]